MYHHNLPHHHHQDAATELLGESLDASKTKCTKMTDAYGGSHTTALSGLAYTVVGALTSAITTLFSLYFPFWLAPQAAAATYDLAFYNYVQEGVLHHFDTTVWTYGTDYGLAVVMLYFSWTLYASKPTCGQVQEHAVELDNRLCRRIWGLLLGYAVSVTAGAISHQFYTDMTMRNTWHFRLLWTICVGTVTLASLSMGCIGCEMARQFQPHTGGVSLPFVPELFWKTFGLVTTAVCAFGWFSYQRPACDIFIAGITQFPSSFYMITVLWQAGVSNGGMTNMTSATNKNNQASTTTTTTTTSRTPLCLYLRPFYQWMGMLSFIMNAPLLPLYPLLVQYTNWSLATVNTFLHTWLLITWSMQAISLRHVRHALLMTQQRPYKAVPIATSASAPAVVVVKKEN